MSETTEIFKEMNSLTRTIQKTFDNVSADIKTLTANTEKIDKSLKSEIDKMKKDMLVLTNTLANFRKLILEVEKKAKRKTSVPEETKKVNNKDEIRELKLIIADMKTSIKNIEIKLKMD